MLSINISAANLINAAAVKVVNLQPVLIYFLSAAFYVRNFRVASLLIPFLGRGKNSGGAQLREEQDDQKRNRVRHVTSEQMFHDEFHNDCFGTEALWNSERLANAKTVSVDIFGRLCSVLTRSDSM